MYQISNSIELLFVFYKYSDNFPKHRVEIDRVYIINDELDRAHDFLHEPYNVNKIQCLQNKLNISA